MKKMILLVSITICFFIFPATFGAHADLASSKPLNGAILTSMPPEVELKFSTVIDGEIYKMNVLNEEGNSIANGKPIISSSRDTLTVPILETGNGLIKVPYSVISKDGHPIEGMISFTLKMSNSQVLSTEISDRSVSYDEDKPSLDLSSSNESSQLVHNVTSKNTNVPKQKIMTEVHDTSTQANTALSSLIKSAYLLSLLLLTGALLWRFLDFKIPYTLQMQLFHLCLLALFTWSQARNFKHVFEDLPWQDLFLRTEVGQLWTAAIVITILGLYILGRNRNIDIAWVIAILLVKSLNSHAIATETPFFTVGLNFIHLVFAALWIGGLFYALILWKRGMVQTFIPTFSKVALLSILVLTVTGSIYAWILAPEISALWTTTWGYWLIGKIMVVFVIYLLGGLIRQHMKKNGSLKEIRFLYFDTALAITILIIVGVLTQLSPSL